MSLTSLDDDIAGTRGVLTAETGATVVVVAALAPDADEGERIEARARSGRRRADSPRWAWFLWIDHEGFAQAFAAHADPLARQVLWIIACRIQYRTRSIVYEYLNVVAR